jgi:hypothetical protein
MEHSMLIARILGPLFIVVTVGVLSNLDYYLKMINGFIAKPIILYMGGVMALFFGLLIVEFHNVWIAGWVVIITLLGWISLLKGCLLLMAPESTIRMFKEYAKNTTAIRGQVACGLLIGIYLTFMGYMDYV